MVRITPTALIIEIPTHGNSALSLLHDYQTALLNVLEVVDFRNTDTPTTEWAITRISRLISLMLLDGDQLETIEKNLEKSNQLSKIL